MTRNVLTRSAVATVVAGALAPGLAGAASFQILEQSPSLQGLSFAGTASTASNASTVFFNPAGMSRLEGSSFHAGGSLILPVAEFNDDGSLRSDGSTPQSGPDGETDESGFVPSLYYVRPLTDEWTFGLGINAPWGLSTSYDKDWVGRYHATDSSLAVLNINPTFAFQATPELSLGFGLNYQQIDATLENEVDSFAACTEATGATPTTCADGSLGTMLSPSERSQDSSSEITADDNGVGLDLSLLYELSERTRIGVLWRQGVDFTLEGDADFDQSTACAGNAGCNGVLTTLEGNVEADVELPDTLNLSVSHGINDSLTLHGDLAFTEWSSIQEVVIENTDNGETVSTLELKYDDTVRYAFGATYADGGPWTWRGGIAFDEAPQTDPEFQTPRVPDQDRTWLSAGFGYAFAPDATLDFGYTHILVDDAKVNNVEQGNTLKGEFDPTVNILAVSGNWRF